MRRILHWAPIALCLAVAGGCGSSKPAAPAAAAPSNAAASPASTAAAPTAAPAGATANTVPSPAGGDAPTGAEAPMDPAAAQTATPAAPASTGPKLVESITLPASTSTGSSPSSPPPGTPVDTTYITAEPFAAMVVHPRKIFDMPEVQAVKPQLLAMAQQSGVDFGKIDEMVVLLGKSAGDLEPYGIVIRLAEPISREQLLAKSAPGATQATHEGISFYRVVTPKQPSVCFVDDLTIVMAEEANLFAMLAAKDVDSPLTNQLRSMDRSHPVLVACMLDPVRAEIQGALAGRPIPPSFAEFAKAPDYLSSIAMWVSLEPPKGIHLRLVGKDEASATALDGLIEKGKQQVLTLLDAQAALMQQQPLNPQQKAAAEAGAKEVRQTLAQLAHHVEGNVVVASIQPEGESGATGALALLPPLPAAVDTGQATSLNNLKQIGVAFAAHHDTHKKMPAALNVDAGGKPLLSWRVHLLPLLGQEALYKQFHLNEPWDSEHNKSLIASMPEVYRNPSLNLEAGHTTYVLIAGEATAFYGRDGTPLSAFSDGAGNTITVLEANPEYAIAWTRPLDLSYPSFDPAVVVGKARSGGFLALFADGSARFVATVPADVFRAMCTHAGGEPIPPGTLQ